MSAIVDSSVYYSRRNGNAVAPNSNGNSKKTFTSAYRNDGIKVFDDKQNKFTEGPISSGSHGVQILTSPKTDTIYTGSSVVTGYRDDGYINSFVNMEDAVRGKIEKSVDCFNGPFLRGLILNADVGINLIVSYDLGTTNLLDCNMVPIKKIPASEFGPSNDMSINLDDSTLVIVNHDASLTLVDIKTFSLEERYHAASAAPFTGVDFSPVDKHVFISSSMGSSDDLNYVTLWDKRLKKGTVHLSPRNPVGCLAWSKKETNLVSLATINGSIQFTDIRNPRNVMGSIEMVDQQPICRINVVKDKLIGFNETNNLIRIDEKIMDYKLIETGLPSDFIVTDVVEYKSAFYAIGPKTIFPRPINIEI